MKNKAIVIAAGGTGGHLFPAIAVAEKLQGHGFRCVFVGTKHRIESTVVPNSGFEYYGINIPNLPRKVTSFITFPFNLVRSILRTREILKSVQPDAVLCAGAYISVPVGLAAKIEDKKIFLMESNAIPGKALLLLSRFATHIFTTFSQSNKFFPGEYQSRIIVSGNPIRSSIISLPAREESHKLWGLNPDKFTILCVGGSLGAKSINETIEKLLPKFIERKIQLIWQTGKNNKAEIPLSISSQGIVQQEFISDMSSAFGAADLVISRAGATTISEICVAGKPSILVPYPQAADDHQTANAKAMVEIGASEFVNDQELSTQLEEILFQLIGDEHKLQLMGNNAHKHISLDSSTIICNTIISELL